MEPSALVFNSKSLPSASVASICLLALAAFFPAPTPAQRSYNAGSEGATGGARGSSTAPEPAGTQIRTYRAGEVTGADVPRTGRPSVVTPRNQSGIDDRHEPVNPPMRDEGPQRVDFRRPYDNRPGEIGLGGPYDPGHHRPWRPWQYHANIYPYVPLYYSENPEAQTRPSSASYEIVKPAPQIWVQGHYEKVPMEDVIEGETIEVFHPAIYEQDSEGGLTLVEKERTSREPKTRIIMVRVWIEGHYEPAPPDFRRAGGDDGSTPMNPTRAAEQYNPQGN